jgi:hypothetical protein
VDWTEWLFVASTSVHGKETPPITSRLCQCSTECEVFFLACEYTLMSFPVNRCYSMLSVQEKRIVAPIRCGGVPKSYSKQLLLVGDAAGHVDPLTGE